MNGYGMRTDKQQPSEKSGIQIALNPTLFPYCRVYLSNKVHE